MLATAGIVSGTAVGIGAATAESDYVVGALVASDEFDRAVDGGWGAAALGGSYTLSVPARFAADGVSGVVTPPRSGSSLTASLPTIKELDVQAATAVSIATMPNSGNGMYAGLEVRSTGSSYYLGSLRFGPGGAAFLSILRVNGSTTNQVALVRDVPAVRGLSTGTPVHLEVQATGTNPVQLRARAWTDGQAKPAWQARIDDSSAARLSAPGSVAIWTYASSTSTVSPLSYGNLAVNKLLPPATPAPATTTAPTVAPAPPTAPAPAQPAPPATSGVRGTPGALPIGTANYAVPAGAVVVAPTGSNTNAGTVGAPLQTLTAAIAKATSGSTIVLRAGSYHGSFVIPTGKKLTIQSYPGEAVWLDGSRVVSNWASDGSAWVASNWTVRFDSSPTYTRGAPDNTTAGWQFVNPAWPMAAHPDQVWIDGVAQRQVASRSLVVPGSFYVDYTTAKLYLGSNPAGKQVRASDTVKALVIAGAGSTVRGIGIARYAPSVPDIGAVAVSAVGVTLENVEITDSATTGLAVFTTGAHLRDLTIRKSGMLGAQASTADGLVASGLLITQNNTEHFNRAPVSGGFKIHKSRIVSVTDSAFVNNEGNSLWFDESVYGMTITGNDIIGGTGNGIVVELSATAVIADNVIMGNALDGVLISDSGHVDVWNNTISGSFRSVNIVQGFRRASDLSLTGHDTRQTLPDPTVTWITEDVQLANNVFAQSGGKCLLCVEDYSHERSAKQMGIISNGNIFHRDVATLPAWVTVWSTGAGNPAVYTTLKAFSLATGQDVNSAAMDGTAVLNGATLTAAVNSVVSSVARPLDSRIAALVGQPAGVRALGAWPS